MPNCGAKVKYSFEISSIFARNFSKNIYDVALCGKRDYALFEKMDSNDYSTALAYFAPNDKMKKIIGIGNALVDVLVQVPDENLLAELGLPKGSMQLIDAKRYATVQQHFASLKQEHSTGGSACNTILAISHLGGQCALIGKVGQDAQARFFTDSFHAQGVETRLLVDSTLSTGVASTIITPDGQRTFGTHLGAAATLTASDLEADWFAGYDLFYIEGYLVQNHELITRSIELAHQAGLQICIDLASYNIVAADRDFFKQLMPRIDIVFANEQEAAAFTGSTNTQSNLEALASVCHLAVVKTGKRGVLVRRSEEQISCPARDVPQVIDTTAAGDYFSAGFLYALAQGRSLMQCAEVGSLLAGHIIEVVGTALPADTWQTIRSIVK